mgnify:CR=1 FL=1|jgi:hypothetical protein
MKQAMLAVFLLITCLVLLTTCDDNLQTERVYDCGVAEWHPDIPKAVKDACRKRGTVI